MGAGKSFNAAGEIASATNANNIISKDDGWKSWNDYKHVTNNGKTYAKVNGRNYSRHAVDRMQPSGFKYTDGQAIIPANGDYGRSVSPHIVEYVIGTSTPKIQPSGNISYTNGSVTIITNSNGDVVTIMLK